MAGNTIGIDGSSGLESLPGVRIKGGSTGNTIGGTTPGARNLLPSVAIVGAGSSGNLVEGNFVGLDASGTKPILSFGISINSGTPAIQSAARPPEFAENVLAGPLDIDGVGTSGNLVEGNYIGIDVSGTLSLGVEVGVNITGGVPQTRSAARSRGARNVISAIDQNAITIENSSTSGNVVEGNYIGTDASGMLPLGNPVANDDGVVIELGATLNTIGGTTAGTRTSFRTAAACQSSPLVQAETSSKGTTLERM